MELHQVQNKPVKLLMTNVIQFLFSIKIIPLLFIWCNINDSVYINIINSYIYYIKAVLRII